jgi:Na+-transporting methylmalonyl-CoA/oxaloacetate decarboxylase gamma subunit
MIQSTIVLAQASGAAESDFASNPGGIVVVGFLFAITVLTILASVTALMGSLFSKQAARAAERAAEAARVAAESSAAPKATAGDASPAVTGGAQESEDESVLAAVIAAAVHTALGDRPHRVVSVRSSGPGWAQEGRRQIFSSHRVR